MRVLSINEKQTLSLLLVEQSMVGWSQGLTPQQSSDTVQGYQNFLSKILKYVNLDAENDLRDFLYSPEGIATIIGLNITEVGVIVTELLFSILLVYDIKKWVNKGEPNWLYLITDILSIATAGFASSAGTAMINAGKTTAFKSISQFFVWVKKLYPTIWSKFIVPLGKSIGGIINKITKSLSNLKINKIIPDVVIKYLGKTKEYLINLKLLIEKNIEKITGKKLSKVIKKMLPYINPLLGSDKIDPFIIDLIQNSNKIDLSKYNILPIFKNNSLDTF